MLLVHFIFHCMIFSIKCNFCKLTSIGNVSCMKWNVVKVYPRELQRYQSFIDSQGCDLPSFVLVGQSGDGSVCPFVAKKANTLSSEFLEKTSRRWLSPQEGDGSDGSSKVRMLLHGALGSVKRSGWQTAGT